MHASLASAVASPSRMAIMRSTRASRAQVRMLTSSSSAYQAQSSSSSSPLSSSRSPSSRSSRRSSRFAARPGADMVGPPDSLSNLRPVKYGSAFEEEVPSTGASMSITHPYSLSEFNQSASSSWGGASHRRRGHSLYFERLLERLEEAELAHKLRRARADNFNQRFWQDNNARFIEALEEFRSRTSSSKAVATLKTAPAPTNTNAKESELEIDSDVLATFYSAWLKANATRHRAYNRQLWSQSFEDLAPAFRYQALRAWAKLVGATERKLGWTNQS